MADPGIKKPSEKELGLRDSTEAERALEKVVAQIAALKYSRKRDEARFLEGYFEGILWCYSRSRGRLGTDLERALREVMEQPPEVEGAPRPSGALSNEEPKPAKSTAPTTSQE